MAQILIVEDERLLRNILATLLLEQGHEVTDVASAEQAVARLEQSPIDLVLLDLNLPGMSGLEMLRRIRQTSPRTTVILMTAFGTIASAVEAMRVGAFDYLSKPLHNEDLLQVVERALAMQRLSCKVETLQDELESAYGFNEIIGVSPAIREVFRLIAKVARVNATVLITGESGTGKELVARAIHRRSERAAGNFVAVNCSAIPQTLVEAEFFGHEKGAFTDAHARRTGRFEEAHEGTLFLDEIGDLALDAQAKLLRALQERQVHPIGGRPKMVDVRVIAATNKNLAHEVETGRFREDLFWRLNVVPVKLPPLRERREDLPLLIDHFLAYFNRELGLAVDSLTPEAQQYLIHYDWPGNVRELENTICRSMILCEGKALTLADLPARVRGLSSGNGGPPSPEEMGELKLTDAVQEAMERLERRLVLTRLIQHQGNRTSTAKSLGISRKTLFNKIRQYGINE